MTLQHISVQEVKAACRKAYDDGALIAQGGNNVYAYELKSGEKCALGCALTDATLELIRQGNMQRVTLGEDEFQERLPFTFDKDEYTELCSIQSAHDVWLSNEQYPKAHREYFLRKIDYPGARIVVP